MEQCFFKLDKSATGEFIYPDGAIVLKMIEIPEFTWKISPDTGEHVWLECVRAVVDGSEDKREIDYYTATPSRSVFLLLLSIEATLGIKEQCADAIRAHLNAESIDRNIVIIFPKSAIKYGLEQKC